MYENYKVKKI